MNMLVNALGNSHYFLLVAATAALPLLLIVLVVDLTLGRRLAPAYRSLLWTLVAVRLLVPIGLPNTLGVPNLWWAMVEGESPHEPYEPWRPKSNSPPRKADSPPVLPAVNVVAATGADLMMPPQPEKSSSSPQAPTPSPWWGELVILGLLSLWPLGALILFGRSVIGSVRFASRLRKFPVVNDPAVTELFEEVARLMLIRRVPKVKYVPGLSAPALFGSLRPTVCLPETELPLSRDELRMVLTHELAHLVRYDGYVAWLLVVVQAVHWFNPLAWFVTRQVAHTRELACDEAVRRFTSTTQHPTYGDLIVRFASARPSVNLGLVGLWFARPIRRLKSRVAACSPERARRWRLPRPVSLLLLAVVASFGLSDRAPSRPVKTPPVPVARTLSPEVVTAAEVAMQQYIDPRPAGTEVIEEREYDVAAALTKLAEVDPEADSLHWLLTHIRRDGEKFPKPALVAADLEAGKITLRMSRNEHAGLAQALAGIERSGPWKIDVEIRFFRTSDLAILGDLDWSPYSTQEFDRRDEKWPPAELTTKSVPAISMASTSSSHGAFKTVKLDDDETHRLVRSLQNDRRSHILNAPRVTFFNNTGGIVRDELISPYVTGLVRSKDLADTKLRPIISVHSEGSRLEIHASVVDSGTVELSCRAVFSEIESVREARVPGSDDAVQSPFVSQLVFQAHRCRFEPGHTLVVGPLYQLSEGDGHTDWMCFALTPRWSPATAPHSDVATYVDETTAKSDNP